jgi:predicted acetyltransferase
MSSQTRASEPPGPPAGPALALRPLREDDEPAYLDAVTVMAAEGHVFGPAVEPGATWAEQLRMLDDRARGVNLSDDQVPATFLVADVGGTIVGRAQIRHQLNDFLEREGGHIGYCVLPAYRRRGYATEILRQSLAVIRALRVDRVLVCCDDDNAGSIAVIERCGGKLDTVTAGPGPGPLTRRYWITPAS